MKLTKEVLEQLKAAKSVEELVPLAKEQGIDLTQEAAKDLYKKLSTAAELTDEMLDEVSGGGVGPSDPWTKSQARGEKGGGINF